MSIQSDRSSGNNDSDIVLDGIDVNVSKILDRALDGKDISSEDAVVLLNTTGREFHCVSMVADELRFRTVGAVSYTHLTLPTTPYV